MSQSQSHARYRVLSHSLKPYTDDDANETILHIMKQIKARNYYTQQFQRIQQQTNMGRSLYFSNVAPTFYEENYLAITQETSVSRVRACFFIGFVGLTTLYVNEWQSNKWAPSDVNGRSKQDETTIMTLTFGVMLPVSYSDFLPRLQPWSKISGKCHGLCICDSWTYHSAAYSSHSDLWYHSNALRESCCIGWSIFFSYLVVMMSVRNTLPQPSLFDSFTDISYQAINYGITAIGGMVSQYRQELLRRRNFCLQLPFSGTMDADAVEEIKTDKFSKETLMHRLSLKFRHPEVEECFYRYWYLIDPFPYENPNSGSLHQGVFRTIRFAIWTLLLNQLVLLLQDIKFLKVNKDELVDDGDLTYALVLRFGVTVPLYFSAALFMYFLGKAFYARWVKEAEEAKNAALTRDSMVIII
ncbi:hypothetical protein Plhal304r1_c080g0166301 [Plasmopara halstedii]